VTAWFEILHLKQVFRKGWLERGLPPARCESVAEHSFGNAMLCLLLAQQQPDLNVEKILRMALIHDLGEVYVGDLTPTDAVDPQEKYAMEKQAVLKILSALPAGKVLLENWEEYEAQVTPEARFVKQVDRLEFALQAAQYEQADLITAADLLQKVGSQLADAPALAPFACLFPNAERS
jgi:putative hydrolase of HD superfamily